MGSTNLTSESWIKTALELFSDSHVTERDEALRGQYAENRMFLRRIAEDHQRHSLTDGDMADLESAFLQACRKEHDDPMLALEIIYLDIHDKRRRQASRPVAESPRYLAGG